MIEAHLHPPQTQIIPILARLSHLYQVVNLRVTTIIYTFVAMKIFLLILGVVSLALAVVGIFLPLLPTTPLLLLAAWCFLRSSERLYTWLINHPYVGEYIRNFRENKAIPLHAKIISVTMIWLTIGYCVIAIVDILWVRIVMLLLAAAISWHILSYKTLRRTNEK